MRLTHRFELATASSIGRVRRNNEDFHRASVYPTPRGNLILLAVADGMGGAKAGEFASKIAIESLHQAVRAYAEHLHTGRPAVPLERVVEKGFQLAQRRILQDAIAHPERKGMGTTLTALLVSEWNYNGVIGHIGDSRAYRYNGRDLTLLTQDHSWVAEQVQNGVLTPGEAETHPWRSVLTRALGIPEATPDLIPLHVMRSETYILATDGLYNLVPPEEWLADLEHKDLQAAVDYWISQAIQRGGTDNITVVTVRIR
ncbi:PP2C family protein-serine/threonine phosphatase [Marinithermus hydrothermalis]|uniref:Protein serine/threonine phosphatase n=1 Tax=Marinithermus hydrothermalis (strain DSM 14884 / JCM 11576 / T1) TaxID=869210 RepID=F2NNY9_MARHT|nr:protein phosphatase 2C domain-containing protein [Marinithermus hydrothermalis]AEB11577.1 protein serine/threonine phosphatase [Marinithermus hydrothermalis DSM 14884]